MHTFILLSNKCGHRNVLSKRQVWMSIFHIINFHVKEIYVIFIHLFDSVILLIIDLNKKKGKKGGGEFYL
jgi:hypothetical protein